MAKSYTFGGRARVGNDPRIVDALKKAVPLSLNVYRAAQVNDRMGVDYWVELPGGRVTGVDVKFRSKTYGDDVALETWSVVEKQIVGWTRDKTKLCDWILFFWGDTEKYALVSFPHLCAVFCDNWQDWAKKYNTRQQFTRASRTREGYHSEIMYVPIDDLLAQFRIRGWW